MQRRPVVVPCPVAGRTVSGPNGVGPNGVGPNGVGPNGAGGPGGFGERASGTVGSVSGDVIVVTQTDPTTNQTTDRTVTVTSTTMYTRTATAASDTLVVGKCAVVQGSADSKGAVTATSIAVSAPPAGSTTCNTGFGRGRNGQGGAGQGGARQGGAGAGVAPSTAGG